MSFAVFSMMARLVAVSGTWPPFRLSESKMCEDLCGSILMALEEPDGFDLSTWARTLLYSACTYPEPVRTRSYSGIASDLRWRFTQLITVRVG